MKPFLLEDKARIALPLTILKVVLDSILGDLPHSRT